MVASGHAPGAAVVGATVALTTVAFLATVMRLFTRLSIVRKAGLDDICICTAMVFSIVMTVTMCEQVHYGLGRHFDTLSSEEQPRVLQWLWASIWVYYLALGSVKCSILLQYLRIFPQSGFRLACYIMIGIVSVYTGWTTFSAVFACWPIQSFWDPSVPGHCLNRLAVWFSNAAINICTDIATAVLPLPVLRALQLPKRQKLALMAVFALGGFTCIVSILRLQSLYVISKATDVTWENPLAAIWSNMEVNIGILCSCLPTLQGCVTRFFPNIFSDLRSKSSVVRGLDGLTPHHRSRTSTKVTFDGTMDGDAGRRQHQKSNHDNSIHILTVLEQDVEMSNMETESVRGLVREDEHEHYRGL